MITHANEQLLRAPRYFNVDAAPGGVTRRVRHGLLHRPVDGVARVGAEMPRLTRDLQGALPREAFDQPLKVVHAAEPGRAQHVDGGPRLL